MYQLGFEFEYSQSPDNLYKEAMLASAKISKRRQTLKEEKDDCTWWTAKHFKGE